MAKKFLWTAIVSGVMLCFLFSTNATASHIEATLGWHNLMDDFYLVVEGSETFFSNGDKIKTGELKNSFLVDSGKIDPTDLELAGEFEIWGVDTTKSFDKWIAKTTEKQLQKAAKNQQIAYFGKAKGWEDLFKEWEKIDLWSLYEENLFIEDAFNELEGHKINGTIGKVKFKAVLNIFENPLPNPVPEPATMILFGLGLLGVAGVSRRKQ